MSDLAMIVPSRGRPGAADAVRASFLKTSQAKTSLVFALDDSDERKSDYPPIRFTSPSDSTVSAMNNAAGYYAQKFRYVGFAGDDCRFITPGWDRLMVEKADQMGGGIVYPNDLMDPGALPSIFIVSSSVVKALGFMAPPPLKAIFFDNFWLEVGRGINRIQYMDDVVVQHISLPNPNAKPNNDPQVWTLWRAQRLKGDIETARQALAA